MWAQMVFQNIRTLYFPMVRRWDELPPQYALPVYTTGEYLVSCRDKISAENCAELNVLVRGGVEPLCLRCEHSIHCSINKRERGDKFKEEEGADDITHWDAGTLSMLQSTMQIPWLTLLRDLDQKLRGKPMEVEFVAELYNVRFDLYRIMKNLDILSAADPKKLSKYETINAFIDGDESALVPGNLTLKNRLQLLKAQLKKYDIESFKEAIETMQL